jgi:DNA-directed RNA polymerase specialized sigma24 family protein
MGRRPHDQALAEFEGFVASHEPRLRVALVAAYGPYDGRAATVDVLSWAWEHWDRLRSMDNPVGYLYRVGQSASRRYAVQPIPIDTRSVDAAETAGDDLPGVCPELAAAVGALPAQQRVVLMLVHAFGWTQRDVARLLEINPSTVKQHLDRALTRLSHDLEVRGVR